ncbi:zinc ribbon domain-containing protein [Desulfotalea psychrophila]|uniref:Uncharacterized protein n=1 Tax=Desulfotalea psychrophila (strain LSv54 / DSM 12343) TaxID=177439 RepID=Q6ARB4_DESPS|nr:hypothetical protein [Desulfotalea psychrophila]CAG35110.1 hypothetical protein DP0381 [Desulfotalea psychrophila LSv54]
MADSMIKECPDCGQRLRFPTKIGGMLMKCPQCGTKFYSDFRVKGDGAAYEPRVLATGMLQTIFEAPSNLFRGIRRYFGG